MRNQWHEVRPGNGVTGCRLRNKSLCLKLDPVIAFPVPTSSPYRQVTSNAKAGLEVSIVPRYLPIKEAVFGLRAAADIVDYEIALVFLGPEV